MFEALQKFFPGGQSEDSRGPEDVRVATCVLLLEAAHADRDFSEVEKTRITDIVARRFGLGTEEAASLMKVADEERARRDDLYSFARQVNEQYTRPRKLAVIELLWEVVFSDLVLEAHEAALMHKLGNLLGIRHDELMALKLKVKGRP